MKVVPLEELERGFHGIQDILVKARQINEATTPTVEKEGEYAYSPFSGVVHSLETDLRKLRTELIERAVETLNEKYSPNIQRDVSAITKGILDQVDREGFPLFNLKNFFEQDTMNKKELAERSEKELVKRAQPLLGWVGDWDNRSYKLDIDGNRATFRASTWFGDTLRIDEYLQQRLQALNGIIDIVAGNDPTTAGQATIPTDRIWKSTGLGNGASAVEEFYKKTKTLNPLVRSYRFYKNAKLEIEFNSPETVQKIAQLLEGPVER